MRFLLKPFAMLATGNLRGLFAFLLTLALFGALWETSLVNLSTRATATAVMTDVGIEIVNPALQRSSFGLSQAGWAVLQAQAIANPTKPVVIPGLKVQVLGSQIAHKSFADGSRVIYRAVAQAYYDHGAGAVFSVSPPTILPPSLLPTLLPSLTGKSTASQPTTTPTTGPKLPTIPLPPLGAVGLSPAILTADGHQQALNLEKWLIGAVVLLTLLVSLSNRRWRKLGHPAWSYIVAPIPGLMVFGFVWYWVNRTPAAFAAITGLLKLLGGVFVPLYVGSAAIGVAGLVVAAIGGAITDAVGTTLRARREAKAWKSSHMDGPRPAPRYVPGVPTPSYGGPQDFGKSWPESATYPPDKAEPSWQAPAPSSGAPSPNYSPDRREPAGAPAPQRGYPSPAFQPGGYASDPYGPLPPLGPQDPPSVGGWPPPPQFGPADATWPAPGRPPAPRGYDSGQQDDSPWGQRDAPPWPPSRR